MVWDKTVPAGSRAISLGDDDIRQFKTDLETALRGNAAEGTEAMFPGTDTANPVFRYRGLKGITGARPAAGQYGLYFDTTRNSIQRDNGASWDDIGTLIPAGTVMVFYQASAPVGWTAVAVNDKFLRVVTAGGTGGSTGGTVAASTSLAHSHTVNSHTHDLANHTHLVSGTSGGGGAHTHLLAAGSSLSITAGNLDNQTDNPGNHTHPVSITSATPSTNTSGGATPGTDSQLGAFAYADVVIASKN